MVSPPHAESVNSIVRIDENLAIRIMVTFHSLGRAVVP